MSFLARKRLPYVAVSLVLCTSDVPRVAGQVPRDLLSPSGVSEMAALEQNWTDKEARRFYDVPQGSLLLPYQWFLHLEQPDNSAPFRDRTHVQALGYLARKPDLHGNPDGLPVGFVKDGEHLGLTCAACHTRLIQMNGKAWLIDGGPTNGDFERLQRRLAEALTQTRTDTAKFQRFADKVLGAGAGPTGRATLLKQLDDVSARRAGYNERNLPRSGAPAFGPGRVDAFGAIMNEVASTFTNLPTNHAPADAPVSYPFLWDTPHHDRVQWNGAAPNTVSLLVAPLIGTRHIGALGRNVGEVLGVFGTVDVSNYSLLKGYPASARRSNLIEIEDLVRKLWSPQWPAELGAIPAQDRVKGAALFKKHCASCHHDEFDRKAEDRHIEAKMDVVGTDPTMAVNFATRRARTGPLEDRLIAVPGFRRFEAEAPLRDMLVHTVQRAILGPEPRTEAPALLLATAPRYTVYAELVLDDNRRLVGAFSQIDLDQVGARARRVRTQEPLLLKQSGKILLADDSVLGRFAPLLGSSEAFNLAARANTTIRAAANVTEVDFAQPVAVAFPYKARPLNGVWATAPYLHNGSIRTLDELLKPSKEREPKFHLGSLEFDPVGVGYKDEGDFVFDTTLPGNSNAGHDYGVFDEVERRQLIAYIKSL